MVRCQPSILLVATDKHERDPVASTLRGAGFAVVIAEDPGGALARAGSRRFVAAVVALASGPGEILGREMRRLCPRLPVLSVLEAGALPLAEVDGEASVDRPIDPRRLLDRVLGLVLNDASGDRVEHRHGSAAEHGIAAARVACLYRRLASAASSGEMRLAHDLSRQIGEAETRRAA